MQENEKKYFVGLDVHKDYSTYAILDQQGNLLKQGNLLNIELEEKLHSLVDGNKILTFETTRNWYYIYDRLEQKFDKIFLANTYKTKIIGEAKVKTDKISAKLLADLTRVNLLPYAYIPPKEIRDKREILRTHFSLVELRTIIKNKLHSILSKNGLICPYTDILGQQSLRWLNEVSENLYFTYREEIRSYLEVAKIIKEQIKKIDEIIKGMAILDENAIIIDTHPGIGYYLGLLISYEIVDITRFKNVKKLIKYSRLAAGVHSSGGRRYYTKIIKEGSKWLCYGFIEAAKSIIRSGVDEELMEYYLRIKSKHGSGAATIALARKIAINVYYMLKYRKVYNEFKSREGQVAS